MLPPDRISRALDKAASREQARGMKKHLQPLRGLRGVAGPAITAEINRAWASGVDLDNEDDVADLAHLFSTAFEDGLVAIGLAAAALPDAPVEALDLCERWLRMTDDLQTADALGWLLWGPALLSGAGDPVSTLTQAGHQGDAFVRRAAVLALMAALPVPIEGPAAAGLRKRANERRVAFVDAPQDNLLAQVLPGFLRDENPQVRKAVARVLREWAAVSPDRAEEAANISGGIHRTLRDALNKGLRKGRRPARGA